jgi:excisionase family DNA binding protein
MTPSPWLRVKEAAAYAKVSEKLIYHNIKLGRLRAARLGVRRDIRILQDWLDAWMFACSSPEIIDERAPGGAAPAGTIPFTKRGPK